MTPQTPQNGSQRPYRSIADEVNQHARLPFHPKTPFSQVQARVAVRLVQMDVRRNPDRYKCKFLGVQAFAETVRRDPHNPATCYFYLISLAKYIQFGGSMDAWRSWASGTDADTMRAIHKRPFRR